MSERAFLKRGLLSREDVRLWAHVASQVAPMPGRRPPAVDEPPAPPKRTTESKTASSLPFLPPWSPPPQKAPALPPLAPLERQLRQRVSRGRQPVDGVIDLHGMRQAEAHNALIAFIRRAHHAGAALVIVVTGKGAAGLESERGVLKRLVPHWLADPSMRRMVVGFEAAARGHGGEGALYVRIRKARDPARP